MIVTLIALRNFLTRKPIDRLDFTVDSVAETSFATCGISSILYNTTCSFYFLFAFVVCLIQIQELNRRLQKEIFDHQLAEHRFTEAELEKTRLKNELNALENVALKQDTLTGFRRPADIDPQKLQDHIKKLSLQLDLTNQRCSNFEAKVKTLEGRYFYSFV